MTQYEKIARKGFGERAEKGDVWLGDRTQKVSYLEFSAATLPGSFEQIQKCARDDSAVVRFACDSR